MPITFSHDSDVNKAMNKLAEAITLDAHKNGMSRESIAEILQSIPILPLLFGAPKSEVRAEFMNVIDTCERAFYRHQMLKD